MTIKDMHYDFKKKINKVDSFYNRNFLVPEIDWTLNEAQEMYVKMFANPRGKTHLGFEQNQRLIDDIRSLVVRYDADHNALIPVTNNTLSLPENYWHLIEADVFVTKGKCSQRKAKLFVRRHNTDFERDPFNQSSFEWREVSGVFFNQGLRLFDDGSFTVDKVGLVYIKKPVYMHNAEDFVGNDYYTLPNGKVLRGTQDCELPEHTHREIVDIAVLIATGEIQSPDFSNKQHKFQFTNM